MGEFLRNNWFVVVIAVILISFIGYFIFDANRYNVSGKTMDGKEVVASIDGTDVTADDLYNELESFDSKLLYNMYRNAVINQTIETTDSLKEDASTLESTIRTNAQSNSTDYEASLAAELASYGYKSIDDLDDYCLTSVKEKEMNKTYVDEHFDEYKEAVESVSPRTVSIISMSVTDADELTDDEQEKKDNIDQALEDGSFADAATAFSEDETTAANDGFYGYIDSNSSSSSTTLDSSVISAALELEKGQTSDWITVTDSTTGAISLYKVHVDETDIEKIHESKNEDVTDQLLYAFLQNNQGLSVTIVEENAKNLDIKFNDEDVQKKIEDYISTQKGENE